MTTANKMRVQKHRDKLRAEHCGRLEVWIGKGVIKAAKDLAHREKAEVWEVVQDALQAYVSGHTKSEGDDKP